MRSFVFFFCTLTFAFNTKKGFSQDADIVIYNDRTVSVKKVFKLINEQTDYKFVYRHDLMKDAPKLYLKKGIIKASTLLEKCLSLGNFTYEFTNNKTIIVKKNVPSIEDELDEQTLKVQFKVSGVVTGNNGEPLPGASIVEKGTANGTSTDFDGKYTLSVSGENAILVISYIGYTTKEVPVQGNNEINIQLQEDASQLDEVVVVGYGTQRKIDVTGSVSSIKTEELNRAPAPNLANSLAGKLTGVVTTQVSGQPGFDNPTFLIRGQSTFGNNSPLVIIDGIVRGGSLSRINPNEIESITILKDAASTAVYGARAANGVVLITTKRGGAGKASFEYTSSYSFEKPTVRPRFMNAGEYAENINIARANDGNTEPKYTEAEVAAFKSGTQPSTDWWNETTQKHAITERHDLSASGGSEKTKYFFSVGYLNQDGLLKSSGYTSYSVRSNFDTQLTDNLKLSVNLAGRKQTIKQTGAGNNNGAAVVFNRIDQSLPTYPAYIFGIEPERVLGFNGLGGNPIGDANYSGTDKRLAHIFQSTFELNYQVKQIEGLSLTARYAYDYALNAQSKFATTYRFYNMETNSFIVDDINRNLTEVRRQSMQEVASFQVNYAKAFGDHKLSVLAVVEKANNYDDNLNGFRDGFATSVLQQLGAGATDNLNNGGSASQSGRLGYVGRVDYSFADKYLLQANARYDGSYNFHPDRRWGFFPAFSAGWVISKEGFLNDSNFVNLLKLRGSWGQVGNDRIPTYEYLATYKYNNGYVINGEYQVGLFDQKTANEDVTWETATSYNVGLEFDFLNHALYGEVDYFHKRTEDILLPNEAEVPDSFGSDLPNENFGIVENHGVEFSIGHKNTLGDFSYNIDLNGTFAKSEIIDMREPEGVLPWQRQTGRSFGQHRGFTALGIFQTQEEIDNWSVDQDGQANATLQPGDLKYKDLDDDGLLNDNDRGVIGKGWIPEFIYGANLGARYKNFELNVFFQGATNIERNVKNIPFELETNSESVLIDSWSPTNTDAIYPRLSVGSDANNHKDSTFWLKDATYLRLKNIELAYTLSGLEGLDQLGVDHVRIFVSGSNLLTWSKIDNRDPEGPSGIRGAFYPQMKSVLFGLNVKF
ncbi:SusC/RagA family TonB-linked outer membrane protein [Snuella sedimenti]|uniref:TonB-dependent receptor n=1 Tax=Snuella sedimenti TaxID=2798802 RepID=A0A8J7IFN1_9FLAO|nr:TonB-dependent receptor [Snuella sedimenti]MBJ6368072.1 TonB-dependent receptor [Snuella sedimenti]